MRDAFGHPGVQALLQASGSLPGLAGLITPALGEGDTVGVLAALVLLRNGIVAILTGVRTYRRAEWTHEGP